LIVSSLDSCFTKRIFQYAALLSKRILPFSCSRFTSLCGFQGALLPESLRLSEPHSNLRFSAGSWLVKMLLSNISSPIRRTCRRIGSNMGDCDPPYPRVRANVQKVRLQRFLRSPARASPRKAQLCGDKEERRSARAFGLCP